MSAGSNELSIYIGLGSNIKPRHYLPLAIKLLHERTSLLAVSSAWKSPPIGGEGPEFLNAAAFLSTPLSPEDLKSQVLRPIEAELGRVRVPDRFAPRTIDLDTLIYSNNELDPAIWDYAYLAVPLSEIAPNHISLVTGETLLEAANRLRENQKIQKSKIDLMKLTKTAG